jgi:protein arginine N-methyltransferase 1
MTASEVLEHHSYLADSRRNDAYRTALREVVKPGDVVLDLGSGTGLLGFLALEAGASRSYGVDVGAIVTLSRALAAHNRFLTTTFVQQHSTAVKLPEPVDLVICDQMGPFGYEAGLLHSLADANARHLTQGGIMIPSRLDLEFAPAAAPTLRQILDSFRVGMAGLDLQPAVAWAVNQKYAWIGDEIAVVGTPSAGASIDTATWGDEPLVMSGVSTVERETPIDAIAGWFVAQLSSAVSVSNSPLRDDAISRKVALLPLERSFSARPGDQVEIRLRANPASLAISWAVEIRRAGAVEHVERHSTLLGVLVSGEDLERRRTDATPVLGPRTRARLSVLCRAERGESVGEIERAVYDESRDVFTSAADAERFVGEVLADAYR